MSLARRAGKDQSDAIKSIIKKHLGKRAKGRQIIAAFEEDPENNGDVLVNYIRNQLPKDKYNALVEEIAEAVGGETSQTQINNIITDGKIDQLINIGRLDSLTIEKKISPFRDVKQLLVFLSIFLLVTGGIYTAYWRSAQPVRMDGQFNIAVAEFAEIPTSRFPSIAPIASQMLFDSLDNEYQLNELGMNIQVTHEKIGIVSGADQAERVAGKTNAHLVIYGDVALSGENATISPKFYVAESFRPVASELTGQHRLALPLVFSTSEILQYEGGVNDEMRRRAAILIDFTRALVYLKLENPVRALETVDATIRRVQTYGQFDGQEVFYLVGAEAARRQQDFNSSQHYVDQALSINPNYARAYIAQANIYFEQDELDEALKFYQKAAELKDQPYGAFIREKANFGMGNVYAYRYQFPEAEDKPDLAKNALEHYSVLIDSYESQPRENLKEITAWAYFMSGLMHQGEGDFAAARQAYRRSLNLAEEKELIDLARGYLRQVR